MASDLGLERTTGFEPATLTLASLSVAFEGATGSLASGLV